MAPAGRATRLRAPTQCVCLFLSLLLSKFMGMAEGMEDPFTELTHGSADCPCVPPNTFKEMNSTLAPCLVDPMHIPGGDCLPQGYGKGECKAWDSEWRLSCQRGSATADEFHCEAKWCYVDPLNCARPYKDAFYRNYPEVEPGYAYSYATCGFADMQHQRVLKQGFEQRRLRVTFPGDDSIFLKTMDDGSKAGANAALLNLMAEKYSFGYDTVPIPRVSLATHPESSYSACVHAVAINSTDLCVGPFWVMPSRAAMTPFVESFQDDQLYLATTVVSSGQMSVWEVLSRPFLPFSWQVWLMLLAIVIVGAFVHAWLEELRLDTESTPGSLTPWRRISNSVYFMCHSFFAGSSESRAPALPLTPAAQVLYTGFSFFILIVISSYTANLVSFLVATKAPATHVLSLEDAVQKGVRICGPAQLQKRLLRMHPNLASLFVPHVINTDNAPSLLDAIDQGLCGASIMGSYTFRTLQSQGHCDKILLDRMVLSFGLAWPVQQAWQVLFSAATVSAVMDGDYTRLQVAAEQAWMPPPSCPAAQATTASDSLQIGDLAGIVILYALCLGTALVVGAFAKAANQKHVKRHLSHMTESSLPGVTAVLSRLPGPVGPRSQGDKKCVSTTETQQAATSRENCLTLSL